MSNFFGSSQELQESSSMEESIVNDTQNGLNTPIFQNERNWKPILPLIKIAYYPLVKKFVLNFKADWKIIIFEHVVRRHVSKCIVI